MNHAINTRRNILIANLSVVIGFSLLTLNARVAAAAEESVDRVTFKDGKVMVVQDGESSPLKKQLLLSQQIKVNTNGTFRVNNGKPREFKEGQVLSRDGMRNKGWHLHIPVTLDGHVLPAKDTISLQDGKVVVQKDGSLLRIPPNQSIMMNDGTKVLGTGTVLTPDGRTLTLAEGQIITVQGVALQNR